jgi:hypothetical protein
MVAFTRVYAPEDYRKLYHRRDVAHTALRAPDRPYRHAIVSEAGGIQIRAGVPQSSWVPYGFADLVLNRIARFEFTTAPL